MKRMFPFLATLLFTSGALLRAEDSAEKQKAVAPAFDGNFLGMDILANHLGIVLDVSESMNRSLPAIREALRKQMPNHPVLHVDGCRLEDPDPRPRIVNGVAPETVTAISVLGEHAGVDAVLWISDQGDPHNRSGIEALEEVLESRRIRLFLLSLKTKPTPSVRSVAIESEGHWELISLPRK